MIETLRGTGKFNVFAPFEETFFKLAASTVEYFVKAKKTAIFLKIEHCTSFRKAMSHDVVVKKLSPLSGAGRRCKWMGRTRDG